MRRLVTYAVIVAIIQTSHQRVHYAVSPLNGFEQFYYQVKNSRSFDRRHEEETPDMKMSICANILGSPLFRTRHQCETSLNPQTVLEELRQNYPRLYQQAKSSSNAYRMQNSFVNGKMIEERVFFCLSRQSGSRNINQYLVSSEYVIEHKKNRKIMGRFVFLDDKVIALAEEPAIVEDTNRSNTEKAFWDTVYVSWHTKWNSDDVMCKLTSLQKIRLCNTILNAEEYQDKVEFVPEMKNVEPQCELRELRFDYEHVVERDKTASEPNAYKPVGPVTEWTIPCKATISGTREAITRYILRGSHQDHDNYRFYVGMGSPEGKETYLESTIGEKQQAEQKTEEKQQNNRAQESEESPGGGGGGGGGGGDDDDGVGVEDIFSIFGSHFG